MSVDMGMCIKKARVRGSSHTCMGVHMCMNVGRVCQWGKVTVLPLLGANSCGRHRNGDCPWSSGKTPPSFLLPDLYQAIWEGNNVIGTQASSIKGPEGNSTAATEQSKQTLENTGQHQAWVPQAPWAGVTGVPKREHRLPVAL